MQRMPWEEVALPIPNIIVTRLGRADGKMGAGGWLLHAVFFFWGSQVTSEAELLLRKTPRRTEQYSGFLILQYTWLSGLSTLLWLQVVSAADLNLVSEGHVKNRK